MDRRTHIVFIVHTCGSCKFSIPSPENSVVIDDSDLHMFLDGEERESWLLCLVVFLVHRDCCVALSDGAMGLSAVSDCGIS